MSRLLVCSLSFSLGLGAFAACNPYSPDLGPDPFECADDGTCPDGYTCEERSGDYRVCVTSTEPEVDGPNGTFVCANDSSIEPNNDPSTAFVTPIPSMPKYSLVGLAICPVGDRDHFRFGIASNGTDFEATVTGVAGRSQLTLQVLNNSGAMIATGAPVAGSPHVVKVEIPTGLAIGQYSVAVQSSDNTENNYDLVMKVCDTLPCPP